jgi:hypothetical protein
MFRPVHLAIFSSHTKRIKESCFWEEAFPLQTMFILFYRNINIIPNSGVVKC